MPHLAHGKVCHLALPAADVETSARFFADVFGWRVRRSSGAVTFDDAVGEVSGHFVTDRPPAAAPGLLVYLWVDDLAAAVQRVTGAGGSIEQPPGVDPGEPTAWFRDPAGNVLGLYQEPVPR
jgi:uncharacterized protein